MEGGVVGLGEEVGEGGGGLERWVGGLVGDGDDGEDEDGEDEEGEAEVADELDQVLSNGFCSAATGVAAAGSALESFILVLTMFWSPSYWFCSVLLLLPFQSCVLFMYFLLLNVIYGIWIT